MIRKILAIVLVAAALVTGGAAYLFFADFQSSFPDLPRGIYAGVLQYSTESASQVPFVVDKGGSSQGVVVAVSGDDFPPQVVPDASSDGIGQPLIVSGKSARLRFVGRQEGDSGYVGEFIDPVNTREGRWYLRRVDMPLRPLNDVGDLKEWVEVWNDLTVVVHRVRAVEAKIAEQRARIEKLQGVITDGNALRKKADSRFGAATEAVQDARGRLKRRQEEVVVAFRDLELSQQVSPRGRLVALSRESVAREARAIEASLQLLSPIMMPDFEKALEKALRVKFLKEQIEAESKRIAQIDAATRYGGVEEGTSDEADFYSQLQN